MMRAHGNPAGHRWHNGQQGSYPLARLDSFRRAAIALAAAAVLDAGASLLAETVGLRGLWVGLNLIGVAILTLQYSPQKRISSGSSDRHGLAGTVSQQQSLTTCSGCGTEMTLEKTTMTGSDMRTYRCDVCQKEHIVDFGIALWQVLQDARERDN
jgi:hypothetical protein